MAVDYFLKMDGVVGESLDYIHKGEIEIESWSWGETNAGSSMLGGAGAGKVSMQDFNFTMRVNKASPTLMKAGATGQRFKTATLAGRKAGVEKTPTDYLTFRFYEVAVTSYQTGGARGGDVPIDQVSLNFAKIEVEYRQQKPDGTYALPDVFKFDLAMNAPY